MSKTRQSRPIEPGLNSQCNYNIIHLELALPLRYQYALVASSQACEAPVLSRFASHLDPPSICSACSLFKWIWIPVWYTEQCPTANKSSQWQQTASTRPEDPFVRASALQGHESNSSIVNARSVATLDVIYGFQRPLLRAITIHDLLPLRDLMFLDICNHTQTIKVRNTPASVIVCPSKCIRRSHLWLYYSRRIPDYGVQTTGMWFFHVRHTVVQRASL